MAYDGSHEFNVLGSLCRNKGKMSGFRKSFSLRQGQVENFCGEREKFEGFEKVGRELRRIKEICTGGTDKDVKIRSRSMEILIKKFKFLNFSCKFFPGFGPGCTFDNFKLRNNEFGVQVSEEESANLNVDESQLKIINKFKRRKERCKVLNEFGCEEIMTGRIERYNLKGRFGKLVCGSHQLWVYEDDLVVSGVNLRKFKKSVREKSKIQVTFCVNKTNEGGEIKLRPVNIQVKYECINNSQAK